MPDNHSVAKCPWCNEHLDGDGICPTCGAKPQGTTVWLGKNNVR